MSKGNVAKTCGVLKPVCKEKKKKEKKAKKKVKKSDKHKVTLKVVNDELCNSFSGEIDDIEFMDSKKLYLTREKPENSTYIKLHVTVIPPVIKEEKTKEESSESEEESESSDSSSSESESEPEDEEFLKIPCVHKKTVKREEVVECEPEEELECEEPEYREEHKFILELKNGRQFMGEKEQIEKFESHFDPNEVSRKYPDRKDMEVKKEGKQRKTKLILVGDSTTYVADQENVMIETLIDSEDPKLLICPESQGEIIKLARKLNIPVVEEANDRLLKWAKDPDISRKKLRKLMTKHGANKNEF